MEFLKGRLVAFPVSMSGAPEGVWQWCEGRMSTFWMLDPVLRAENE